MSTEVEYYTEMGTGRGGGGGGDLCYVLNWTLHQVTKTKRWENRSKKKPPSTRDGIMWKENEAI